MYNRVYGIIVMKLMFSMMHKDQKFNEEKNVYLTKLKNIGNSFSIALIFSFLHIPQLVNVVTSMFLIQLPDYIVRSKKAVTMSILFRIVHPVSNTQSRT